MDKQLIVQYMYRVNPDNIKVVKQMNTFKQAKIYHHLLTTSDMTTLELIKLFKISYTHPYKIQITV